MTQIVIDFFDSVKNKTIDTYKIIEKETKDLFNGTTIKKIFFSDPNVIADTETGSITSLSEHVKKLHQSIESSKIFMKAIFEKVRYQGRIKIINELNGNPQHPEFQSSFPDLLTFIPKSNKENNVYPFNRIDENFNLQRKKNVLDLDKNYQSRMDKSIQESYVNNFINHNSWEVSDRFDSSKNIISTIKKFQRNYEKSKFFNKLDDAFMIDFNQSLFLINGNVISCQNKENMIQDFKKIIPNPQIQKLISTYANQNFLHRSYLQLLSENPEISQYQLNNSKNIYKIDYLDDGSIKLVATHLSDLNIKDENYIQKYKSFGIRSTVILSSNNLPIIKYSHFLK